MIRKSSFGFLCFAVSLLMLQPTWAAKETKPDFASIFNTYLHCASAAHDFKGTVVCQSQHIYADKLSGSMPKAIEHFYMLPVEDSIYKEHNPLFFKTYTLIDWNVHLDGQEIQGTHKMTNVSTDFYAANAMISNPSNASLKRLKSAAGGEYPITIPPVTTKNVTIPVQIFTAPELFTWHYLPDLWYPEPLKLGFPKDVSKVSTRSSRKVVVYTYTPESLPDSFMKLLRRNSLNDALQLEDLQILLTVARDTNQCKSFQIATTIDKKMQLLFCIANNGASLSVSGFTMPDTTIMYTQSAQKTDEGLKWGTSYFAQYSLKSFERSR